MAIDYNSLWANSALSYAAYRSLMGEQAENGQTSGPDQSESMVHYTALNERRMLRLDRKLSVDPAILEQLQQKDTAERWLVITETWCGDAAQSLPVLNKLAEQTEQVEMKLIWRDEFPDLINAHLTNGSRGIPKLIRLNAEGEVTGEWGPRPVEAQELVMANKAALQEITDETERAAQYQQYQIALQKWYNSDKGQSTAREVVAG